MIHHRFDYAHRYLTTFNDVTGEYFRSNVYDGDGNDTGREPFRGDYPHLLDIGIKGFCEHGLSGLCHDAGVYCYQKGGEIKQKDMTLADYKKLMIQCKGKVFQVALGGRGDPDCHRDYEAILSETRNVGIVPNMTTSGYLFNKEKAKITKQFCGAGAVSWYKKAYSERAINLMLEEGITTNIHFILSEASIQEAVMLMEQDGFPKGIRAVVFLLYKPVGYERPELVLKGDNPYLKPFFDLMNADNQPCMIGFDSCLAPGVLNYCKDAAPECIEPCESGRFSAYISPDMRIYPCSFVQDEKYSGDLNKHNLADVWEGDAFKDFRRYQTQACGQCGDRELCLGGCPAMSSINLCRRLERESAR